MRVGRHPLVSRRATCHTAFANFGTAIDRGEPVKRRVHTFSYFLSPRDATRDVKAFQRRDDAAAIEILSALMKLGYEPGESILNPPPGQKVQRKMLLQVDLQQVKSEDLILLTTRPPMHDRHQGDRKQVPRGFTDLEAIIFDVCSQFIEKCSRSHIVLTDSVSRHLGQGHEGLAEMKFREAQGAPFKALNAHDGDGWRQQRGARTTATFLLHVDSLWEGGPGLLCAFGVDGLATLGWAYRLRHGLSHLLEGNRFLVARVAVGQIPSQATSLCWAEDWTVDIALDHALPAGYLGSRMRTDL